MPTPLPPANSVEDLFVEYRESGDPQLFAELFDRTSGDMVRQARRTRANPADIEDLVQETYLSAILSAARFDPGQSFVGWLRGIMQNKVRMSRRTQRRRGTTHLSGEVVDGEDPGENAALQEARETVMRSVGALPSTYREVVHLYYVEQVPANAIASRLQRTPSTVRTQIARGIEQLRTAMPAGMTAAALGMFGIERLAAQAVAKYASGAAGAAGAQPPAATPLGVRQWGWTAAAVAAVILGAGAWAWWPAPSSAPPAARAPDSAAGDNPGTGGSATPLARAAIGDAAPQNTDTSTPENTEIDVRVRAVDAAHRGVEGVAIGLALAESAELPTLRTTFHSVHRAVTDGGGYARFRVPAGSTVRVRFSDSQGSVARTLREDTDWRIELGRHAIVRGRVVDQHGETAPYARLYCSESGGRALYPPMPLAEAGADGSFAVALAQSRRTRLWAETVDGGVSPFARIDLRQPPAEPVVLTVANGQGLRGALSGTDARHPALVAAYPLAPEARRFPARFCRPDASGKFEFAALAPARYLLCVSDGRGHQARLEIAVGEVPPAEVDLALLPGATVRGQAMAADGAAPRALIVAAVDRRLDAAIGWRLARTAHDGSFALTGVGAGPTLLAAFDARTGNTAAVELRELTPDATLIWNPKVGAAPATNFDLERLQAQLSWLLSAAEAAPPTNAPAPPDPVSVRGTVDPTLLEKEQRFWVVMTSTVADEARRMHTLPVEAGSGAFAGNDIAPGEYRVELWSSAHKAPHHVCTLEVPRHGVAAFRITPE